MGLLPRIAADLIPERFAADPDGAIAVTGAVVSFYALGVVAGMVVTPLLLRSLSLPTTALICTLAMSIWTLATALAPTLELVVALRFMSSLTHASYVGIAAILVGRMLGPAFPGRGAALVMGGFAIANLLGVPLGTQLGAFGGWRPVLACCAILFLVPAVVLVRPPGGSMETRAPAVAGAASGAAIGPLARLIATGTVIAIGGFTLVTFVAPLTAASSTTDRVPVIPVALSMLLFGIGMTIGNFGGGWLADRSADLGLLVSAISGALGAALVSAAAGPWLHGASVGAGATAIGMLLVGVGVGTYSPAAQLLFVQSARAWPKFAASLVSGTSNLGSFLGATIGGIVLSSRGPQGVAVFALVLLGCGVCAQLLRMRRNVREVAA